MVEKTGRVPEEGGLRMEGQLGGLRMGGLSRGRMVEAARMVEMERVGEM